jgi:hypothetical protein
MIGGLNGELMRSFHGLSFHDILATHVYHQGMIAFMLFIVFHTI